MLVAELLKQIRIKLNLQPLSDDDLLGLMAEFVLENATDFQVFLDKDE